MVAMPRENPATLYRYYSNIEYAIQLISSGELYFSSPENFNDPYDFFPSVTGIGNYAEILCDIKGMRKAEYKKKIQKLHHSNKLELINFLRKQFKVCCFTENFDSFSMWSYYADKFHGCCIGFNTNEMMKPKNNLDFTFKVQYVVNRPKFGDMKGASRIEQIALLAATKNKEYLKENEWRCIKYLDHKNPQLFCPSSGIIKIDHKIIKEIIVGSNILPKDFARIKALAQKLNLKVYQIKTFSAAKDFQLTKQKL